MVESRSPKTPVSENIEEIVKATPSKTPREVVEIPDEQSEEPKSSGRKKFRKQNAEDVESDEKNGVNDEGNRKNVDKFEAVEYNGEEMIAADKNVEKLTSMEKNGKKLNGEDINGLKLKSEENNGEDLTADKMNGEDSKTEERNGKDLKSEQKNAEGLKIEQAKSTAEQNKVATEPKTGTGERKSAKKAMRRSKLAEEANSEVSTDKLDEEQKQLDIDQEEQKQLDNAEGNKKQLSKVEVEQKDLEKKEIVLQKNLVKAGFEEENVEDVEGEDKQTNAVEASTQNLTSSERKERKRSTRLEVEEECIEKVENLVLGLQKEQSGEKRISSLEPINAETVERGAEQEFTVEMNTDNGESMTKKSKKSHKFFQKCKEKKVLRDAEKMKIDQGISDIVNVEMGQDGAKENSHMMEGKPENENKRGKKRKKQNREKEEGANKSSREGQKVNSEKGTESKEMKGETNAKKKQSTYSNKEINNSLGMNPDNKKSTSKKLEKARKFFRRSREMKLRSGAGKRKIDQGISEIDEVEMGQEGVKEYSNIEESKQENVKKRGKKRKNQNIEKEEGANKNSAEGLKVNGEKGAKPKGMEGDTNAKKKRTTCTNKEINNFVEMNTDNGKPMSKKLKRSCEFVQMCKEKRLLRYAEKMKIDQGISDIDKEEIGQEGAKENSHIVESEHENKKKRRKKRKNQNREKEEGANKISGEGQKANGKKWADSKGMEGEANAKKQTTLVEVNADNGKPMSKKLIKYCKFAQRCKEMRLLRDAGKMKIDKGISEID